MEIEEQFVSYIVQRCLSDCQAEIKVLERDISQLEKVLPPFPRIHYDEAVRMINEAAGRGELVPGTKNQCLRLNGAMTLAALTRPILLLNLKSPSLSIITLLRSRRFIWSRNRVAPRFVAAWICLRLKAMGRSSVVPSA